MNESLPPARPRPAAILLYDETGRSRRTRSVARARRRRIPRPLAATTEAAPAPAGTVPSALGRSAGGTRADRTMLAAAARPALHEEMPPGAARGRHARALRRRGWQAPFAGRPTGCRSTPHGLPAPAHRHGPRNVARREGQIVSRGVVEATAAGSIAGRTGVVLAMGRAGEGTVADPGEAFRPHGAGAPDGSPSFCPRRVAASTG